MTTPPRRTSPASRASRRSRRSAPHSASFLERNRNRLLWLGGGLLVLLVGGLAFANLTTPAYACGSIFGPTPGPAWTAPPAASPGTSGAPTATEPPPGFVQPDMGHNHVAPGTRVKYADCPPASGRHYNAAPQGPIAVGLHGPDDAQIPQGWLHNLEHGALVLLYKCPGPACDAAGQAALQALLEKLPNSPVCHVAPGQRDNPVFVRFDDMVTPYAAVVWDVVLPMEALDEDLLFKFYAGQAERFNPEKCVPPTQTPGPTPTAGPTGTVAPTAAATGSAAPAATTAPSPS